ncbi:MAG TPA: cytochrome b [Caulobacteraceae bacterium]|nr:cytochrome b [Caulobacteraceae bacterium]
MASTHPTEARRDVASRPYRFDPVEITLHWATVALVVVQLTLALTWDALPRPERHLLIVIHMSFGILLGLVVLTRLVWRSIPSHWIQPASTGWDEVLARTVHFTLYGLLVVQACLGFLLRWSGGEAMSFFGFQIPSPMDAWSKAANHQVGEIHEKVGWAIVIIAAGHASAALYHHFVLKDRVLTRMIPALKARR